MPTSSEIQMLRNLLGKITTGIMADDTIGSAYEIAERFVNGNSASSNVDLKRDATIMLARVICYESWIEIVHRDIGHYPEGSRNTLKEIKASADMYLRAVGISGAFELSKSSQLRLPPIVAMSKSAANYDRREGYDIP